MLPAAEPAAAPRPRQRGVEPLEQVRVRVEERPGRPADARVEPAPGVFPPSDRGARAPLPDGALGHGGTDNQLAPKQIDMGVLLPPRA